jgi:hypothetical protein
MVQGVPVLLALRFEDCSMLSVGVDAMPDNFHTIRLRKPARAFERQALPLAQNHSLYI